MAANTVVITLQANNQAGPVVSNLVNQIENRLGGAFQKASFNSGLMIKGLEAGISAVTGLVGKLSEGLSQSVSIQTENISVAGNLMKLTGQNFEQATAFIDEFSIRMSKVAASLPGATSDYVDFGKAIADDVIPAIREANGAIDPKKLQAELQSVSTYGTLLAQQAKVSSTNAAMALSKFLGGTSSMGELSQLDFFQKNTTFRNSLLADIEKLGGDVKKLTTEQRLEIFKRAASIPQEVLNAQSKSIAGLTAGFVSNLFDPQTGLFGFMRDLDDKMKGSQSVLDAIQEGLAALIGDNGLLGAIGGTLKALGFKAIDPMLALRGIILGVNSKIRYLRDVLNNFLSIGDSLVSGRNFRQLSELAMGSEAKQAKLINDLKFLFGRIFNINGLGAAAGNLSNQLMKSLNSIDWNLLGGAIGKGLASIFNEVFEYIKTVDFSQVNTLVSKLVMGIFTGLGAFISSINWGSFAQAAIKIGVYNPMMTGFEVMGSVVGKGINQVIDAVKSFFDNITNSIKQIPVVNNPQVQSVAGGFIKNAIGGVFNLPIVPNFAEGNAGLLSAYLKEKRQSPAGTVPVIANSSEAILTQSQQRALLSNRGGLTIGNITIHTAATDTQAIARDLVKHIEREYAAFAQSRVASLAT
ncbi:hypothetical protein [Anabaena sp. CCY 9402-a]|uniref:hypothetical protein n=1 Tax=Anabaena sp. CCY 9402-a TaxID=3103867 RepID=UPI0039C6E428